MNVTHITEVPNHMFGTVGRASGPTGWYFTVYQQEPSGEVYIWKAVLFDMHEDAIEAWNEWGVLHAWDVSTPLGMCKNYLDQNQEG